MFRLRTFMTSIGQKWRGFFGWSTLRRTITRNIATNYQRDFSQNNDAEMLKQDFQQVLEDFPFKIKPK